MSQRNSEYARQPNDLYVTPQWVWDALYSVEPWAKEAWDCAPINSAFDFLSMKADGVCDSVCTNPPFNLADAFIKHAIEADFERFAFLLPHSFDCAKSRLGYWDVPFKCKYTLTTRIRWDNLEQKKNGPSTNHAWFVWDHGYGYEPRLGWL